MAATDEWVETEYLEIVTSRLKIEWEGWRRGPRIYRKYKFYAKGVGTIWLYKGDGFNLGIQPTSQEAEA